MTGNVLRLSLGRLKLDGGKNFFTARVGQACPRLSGAVEESHILGMFKKPVEGALRDVV